MDHDDGSYDSVSYSPAESVIIPPAPLRATSVVVHRPASSALSYASKRTGLVYDARMKYHCEPISGDDDLHPEDPRRIWFIYKELQKAGLTEHEEDSEADRQWKLLRICARLAEPSEVALAHSIDHYKWVQRIAEMTDAQRRNLVKDADSVYFHPTTPFCARLAAGGAIEATRAVMTGAVKNAIAVIRPPGHHAEHGRAAGFCFFNNVGVAAKVTRKDFPDTCRKILILDWDVHHGNGVQQIFESDPNVLYISLHVHKGGFFYPAGDYGDESHVGLGAGEGKNINIPWPRHHMHDGDYIHAFQQIVMPVAYEFNPDLVLISAGFDAADGDTLGACFVSPNGYALMTSMLLTLANGKVVACLEGGYNLNSIAVSALAVTKILMGEKPAPVAVPGPSVDAIQTVQKVIKIHSKYWKCLYPKSSSVDLESLGGERLHDILQVRQNRRYAEQHMMYPLHLPLGGSDSGVDPGSFSDQVTSTPGWRKAQPLLIIFHDPPDTIGDPHPLTGAFDPHNIVVTQPSEPYIEWAVHNKFSVIDVNVPRYLKTMEDDSSTGELSEEDRTNATRDVASAIWENFVSVSEAPDIFLIGVGGAYAGLISFLNLAGETVQQRVSHIFAFAGKHALLPVARPTDDALSLWYFNHSTVFAAREHCIFDGPRKIRKKYGRILRTDANSVIEQLLYQKEQVLARMREGVKGEEGTGGEMKTDENPPPSAGIRKLEISTPPEPRLTAGTGSSTRLGSPIKLPRMGMFGVTGSGH
ncbi:putative histone deacetylase [Trichodelitschia bisporula]|uniref:histone deacetylase n=1 Tax=Trichodelitschia bisporula TaxID=703511 RepID=A0A6G1HQG9_9PEZI|nr:putative histone deacetylase [Trichodelitschia bisporula]